VSRILILLAPRDGTEITQKRPAIYGNFDFGLASIPPKRPLPKCGCCRTLSDDNSNVYPRAPTYATFSRKST